MKNKHFITLHIEKGLSPIQRMDIIEKPLKDAMEKNDVGSVIGGLSKIGRNTDGDRMLTSCVIDIIASDVEIAKEFLRTFIVDHNWHYEMKLEYTEDGKLYTERLM